MIWNSIVYEPASESEVGESLLPYPMMLAQSEEWVKWELIRLSFRRGRLEAIVIGSISYAFVSVRR